MPGAGKWCEVLDIRSHNHQFFPLNIGEYIIIIVSILMKYIIRVFGPVVLFSKNFSSARLEVCVNKKCPLHLLLSRWGGARNDALGSGYLVLYVSHDLLSLSPQVLELSGMVVVV